MPGILIGLILFVNEIPDRRSRRRGGEADASGALLARRWSAAGYLVAAMAAFAAIAAGVAGGLLPWPTLIAIAAVPLALRVHAGLKVHYDSPYTLMAVMGANVNLNLLVGGLLLLGYLATIAVTLLA